ncbi:16S rRNA (guanine(527)-N(7))-methyltransferase RsmG [Tuberibacillus sp. Marseille-P3662]|uniref:16S rRNA (guanine(527)-N(7))-methyltransferase RsmG n=1 Tax=Tuberibacillus sp. Marseille-P3662 TaxID=1965358 RepID=UPI000A1CABE3|nr:16S rRNA (guanine(527)-N(7))-methyltransferase RsmG [Tuberibacillus sp. Marseille-P3662]
MDTFVNLLQEKGLSLSPTQLKQFDTYFHLLVEWNQKMNLTAITDEKEVYLKHFYDSMTPAFFQPSFSSAHLCDVGAGAGFPSLPLKIVFPELRVSIVDSLKKRTHFLETLVEKLGLEGVELYHDRAETFAHHPNHREQYDVVTARAVARLSVLSEYCLPLVKPAGQFISLKGASAKEEVKGADEAIQLLGGHVENIHPLLLPNEESHRHIIIINKQKKTANKYPRKPGTPIKNPL